MLCCFWWLRRKCERHRGRRWRQSASPRLVCHGSFGARPTNEVNGRRIFLSSFGSFVHSSFVGSYNSIQQQAMRPKMLLLSESDVRRCLTMADCLRINREAFIAVANGTAHVPTRLGLPYHPAGSGTTATSGTPDWTLFKPAAYYRDDAVHMGMKLVSIRSHNPAHGLPLVPATILNVDAATGLVDAVVAGTYLTGMRTATGSALSTALLKPNLQHLVVFGAGLQAQLHVQAIATALGRPISRTTIVNRTVERARQLELPSDWTTQVDVVHLYDPLQVAETLAKADVVVTATNTTTPLFDGQFLPPGCHINGVGSYTPDMQEVAAPTVDRCRVVVDTQEAKQVGDLKHLTESHPVVLLGSMLEDPSSLPSASETLDCTFFKSVGTAIQDVLTAQHVVQRARELGIGTEVDMS